MSNDFDKKTRNFSINRLGEEEPAINGIFVRAGEIYINIFMDKMDYCVQNKNKLT